MITRASECTINQYIKCLFDKNYTVLGEGTEEEQFEAFQSIQTDYIDLSGQFESSEYETIRSIVTLSSRIELINTLLYIEDKCLEEFKHPFLPAFKEFRRFGHSIEWNNNVENFYLQLEGIRVTEQQYIVQLEEEKLKLKKPVEEQGQKEQSRSDFIRMLIGLQKQKYPIDRDKTTVEDLAIMVNELRELMISNSIQHSDE